ncbi:hypothetical protein WJX82_004274 [Trebouxia sp. C0006]
MSPAYKVTRNVSVARATSALRPSTFAIRRTKRQTQCHSKTQGDHISTASAFVACKTLPAAMLAAALLTGTGAMSSEAATSNTSLVDQIHFYQAEKSANSKSQRPATPAQLLEAAAAQLAKVETLIGIGQYDSARLQLRQGAASTIRLDLRAYDRSQHTGPGSPQAGKAIVQEVESLDTALKLSKPADECRQLVRQIRHDMSELLAKP